MSRTRPRSGARAPTAARKVEAAARGDAGGTVDVLFGPGRESLLDVLDHVLNKGVVLSGDLTIGLARIDLIYARLSLLLCAAERILPEAVAPPQTRRPSADRPRPADRLRPADRPRRRRRAAPRRGEGRR